MASLIIIERTPQSMVSDSLHFSLLIQETIELNFMMQMLTNLNLTINS